MFQVVYIMGVSGCGKSTIGQELAKKMNLPFYDGDNFHSKENISKMSSGVPLTDIDREDWLRSINKFASQESQKSSIIFACSALKEKYRTELSRNINAQWIFLQSNFETISNRLENRKDHFMDNSLLKSQFDILEAPKNAIVINASQSIDDILKDILKQLES